MCLWVLFSFCALQPHLAKIHDTIASCNDNEDAAGIPKRKSYELLGVPVAKACLCALLGIGKNRLCKAVSGEIDSRYSCNVPLHRACPRARSVDHFLLRQHGTVAEILPTG